MKKLLLGICLFVGANLLGQGEANIWYFGENAGLDFSTSPPTVIKGMANVEGNTNLMETSASISDASGNFLFGVNGKDIYSADLTKRGTLPDGSYEETAQGAMIIPVPGSSNEYYITTVPRGSGCSSASPSWLKVTVNGTTGNNITIGPANPFPTNNIGHGQMILPKTDAAGNPTGEHWLVNHGRNNNEFHVYDITASGIVYNRTISNGPVMTTDCSGSDHIAYFKSNGCYNQFAYGYGNDVYLFDFDTQTGDMDFQNQAGPITQSYGIEFSPNGKNVYVSTGTTGGSAPHGIYKIPVSPGGLAGSTLGSPTQIGAMTNIRGGAMQLGPDGNIYISGLKDWNGTKSTNYLGVISDPDGAGSFDPQGVTLPNSIVGMGAPSFPASLVSNIARIQYQAGCKGDPIDFDYSFSGSEQTPPERLWQFFGGPNAVGSPDETSTNKTHTYTWDAIGTYAVTLQVKDVCGRTKYDTVQVVIDELVVTVEEPDSVCATETATFTSLDATANNYKWFNAEIGGAELGTGSSVDVVLVKDSVCVWAEPDGIISGPYTAGHSGDAGSGSTAASASDHTFDALKPLKIDGFTVTGTKWAAGTTPVTITIKQGGTTVAGPANATMNDMGKTTFTGLGLTVPQGAGYSIEVTGGPFMPFDKWGTGGVVSVDKIIAAKTSNFLQDWEVYELNPCFSRERVCAYELDCECRDTTLLFADELCVDTLYNLNTLVTDTTYQDGQWVIVSGPGTIQNDSILNVGLNDDGNIEVRYEVYYGADAGKADCADSNVRIIIVNPLDEVDIIDGQGPFCLADGAQTLNLSGTTVTGGTWTLGTTSDATIDATTGEITPSDSGAFWVYYSTPIAGCVNTDSIEIIIHPAIDIEIESPDTAVCKNSGAFQIRLTANSDTDGDWSGDGVGATGMFDPSGLTAGDYVVKYVKNGFSVACSDSDSVTVTINPLDTAIITNPPSLCASDAPYQLTLDLTKTTSGTWADSLGGNSYVTAGGVFDPAGIPDGKIMVVFTTDGACPGKDTSYVIVTSQINFTLPDGDQTFCLNNNPDTVSINVNTGGGKFWTTSGEGISADSLYVVFSLYSAGQVDSLYYGKSGQCGDTVGVELTLLDVDVAEIDSLPEMCIDEDPITYTISGASTIGGTWSGPGIDGATGVFTPLLAGPGIHTIVYTTPGTCATADSVQITVKPRVDVSLDNTTLAFCGTAAAQTSTANLYGGVGVWQGSATWSGLGWDAGMTAPDSVLTFDPNGLTAGTDSIYYMIDENQFVCGDTVTLVVGISAMDVATIDSLPSVCSDGLPVQFTVDVASTPNGDWSGVGIDAAGLFDPVAAGPGTHKIKYKTPGVCWVEDSVHIVVLPKVTLSLTGDQAYCGNALPGVIDANQSGGVWFGNWSGALGYVNDSSQTFDPNLASVGIDSIMYGIAGQCGDTTALVIGIAPVDTADIDTNTAGPFCAADAATQLNLNPSTVGGIWSGGPYINAAGVFDPGTATIGGNTVTYTTQGVCPSVDNFDVQVVGQIIVDLQDAPVEVCNGDANVDLVALLKPITSATNGPWTVTPAKAGVIVGSNFVVTAADPVDYTVKYALYGGTATCADSDSIIIRVLPVLDPSVTAGPAADVCILDGTYNFVNTGDGAGDWSISGAGSIDAATGEMNLGSSGVGTFTVTYGFGGTCPIDSSTTITVAGPGDPTIQAAGPFCENLAPIQLVATGTQGGTWAGTGVNGSGVFDPSTAGAGTHTITYDLGGACPIQGSTDVVVEGVPVMDIQVDNATGCEPLTVTFTDASTGTAGTSVWVVSDGTTSTQTDSLTTTFQNDGCYNISLLNHFTNGCVDSMEVTNIVCVNPVPTADFDWGPKNTTVLEPFIEFEDESIDADTWEWNFGRGSNPGTSSAQNPFVTYTSPDSGTYEVCLAVANGICADTICKDVVILDNFTVYVPNAFTPDGDGLNDVFFPNGKNHDNIEGSSEYGFMIFNRWGELIWESGTPYQPWDATHQKTNKVVQEDVYVWKMLVWDNVEGVLKTYYGHVSVIK